MTQNVPLNTGDVAVEAFFDATQELLSGLAVNFEVVALNPTTVRVPATSGEGQVSVSIDGRYRYVTGPVDRAFPGGSAAGTYDLFVTAPDNQAGTHAPPGGDYTFALAIVATGGTPAGVDLARLMRRIVWSGTAITRIDRLDLEGPARHAASHATAGTDPLTPAQIGAATPADVAAEAALRSAADANNPTANEKAALAGTSGAPATGNRYVTDVDTRNANQRVPTDASVTALKVAASLKPSGTAVAADEALRALGATAATAAAGNDARLSDARVAASIPSAVLITVQMADTYVNRPGALNGQAGTIPANGVTFTATDKGMTWQVVAGAWVLINVFAPEVSSLPASPIDQQECIYVADTTLGIKYHLRYRAASASLYKWESIGSASQLTAFVATNQTRASATYGDLATVGPSIIVPLAGDWVPTIALEAFLSVATSFAAADIQIGATAADAQERVVFQLNAAGGSSGAWGREQTYVTVAAAATTVKMVYAGDGTNNATFGQRRLALRPIRVG